MIMTSFDKAILFGRTPNIVKLFPNSKALIVSGKFVNEAMLKKGKAVCIAVNARNIFIIIGALRAAQRANSILIIEIARSEGGIYPYCSVNFWNISRIVDSLCNQMKISIPVVIHADHYVVKTKKDISYSFTEINSLFEFGITSLAIDASHLTDKDNLITSIKLNKFVPEWSGLETEVGEIKGDFGLSTKDEALFLIKGLNAYDIFPDWIALNNGTVHGIESGSNNIRIDLTRDIHFSLSKYGVFGAQHGTSGNDLSILKDITSKTRTTKANLATALQMISWGIAVDEGGNPLFDDRGFFIKKKGRGVTQSVWNKMNRYAHEKGWQYNNYKRLNLPFDNMLFAQHSKIRERMSKDVENFIYKLMTEVFNSEGTGELVLESILRNNFYKPKMNISRIENPEDWTLEKISLKSSKLNKNESIEGFFED